MCGRITITIDGTKYAQFCRDVLSTESPSKDDLHQLVGRFNVVPSSTIGMIYLHDGKLTHRTCTWWILPPFGLDSVRFIDRQSGSRTFAWQSTSRKSHFNSRRDTIINPQNRYWHSLFRRKRCLIVADGFYEWPAKEMLEKGASPNPWYFRFKDRRVFCFAGIWECITDTAGQEFFSANIITVEPNALLAALPHHRMPAILKHEEIPVWLGENTPVEVLNSCLHPTSEGEMEGFAVKKLVNYSRNDSPECVMPLSPIEKL